VDGRRQLLAQILGELGKATRVEDAEKWLQTRAALLEERVHGRAGERIASDQLEGEHGGLLERIEVEPIGKFAR
jgi:hypothetical protein